MSNLLRKIISKNVKSIVIPLPSALIKKGSRMGLKENERSLVFNKRVIDYLELIDEAIKLKTQEKMMENKFLRFSKLETIAKDSHEELSGITIEKQEAEDDNTLLLELKSSLLLNNNKLLTYWQLFLNALSIDNNPQSIRFEELNNFTNIYFTEQTKIAYSPNDLKSVEYLKEKYIKFKKENEEEELIIIDKRKTFSLLELFPFISGGQYKLYTLQLDLQSYKALTSTTKKYNISIEQLLMLFLEYSQFFDILLEKNNSQVNYFDKTRKTTSEQVDSTITSLRKTRPSISAIKYSLFELYQENRLRTIQLAAFISQLSAAVFKWEEYLREVEQIKKDPDKLDFKDLKVNINNFLIQLKSMGAFNIEK